MRNPRSGFTLVELLVVVTIIVILISLLTPALDRAVSLSERAVCASKLKAIGATTFIYAMNHRRRLPPRVVNNVSDYGNPAVYAVTPNFLGSLVPYLGTGSATFLCPTVREVYTNQDVTAFSDTSYMGNTIVYGRALSDAPGGVIMIQELRYHGRFAFYRPYETGVNTRLYVAWQWHLNFALPQGYSTAHDYSADIPAGTSGRAGGNLLYADQSVGYRVASTLLARDFGLTGGGNVTGTGEDDNRVADNRNYLSGVGR